MLKKLTVITLILSFLPTCCFASLNTDYYDQYSYADSYTTDDYVDIYDSYTDYYEVYDTCEADPSLDDAEDELNDAIAEIEAESDPSSPASANLGSICLTEESFTTLRTTEESTCAEGDGEGLLDHLFEFTVDGIQEAVSSITLGIGIALTGGALCDEETLSYIETYIVRLRLLKRFLGLDPDGLLYGIMKRRVPAPFDEMNIQELQNRIEALNAKIERFKEKLIAECKDNDFIEAELRRLGAYDALAKLETKLILAQTLYDSIDSILGLLESAKMAIEYLCGSEEEAEEALATQ